MSDMIPETGQGEVDSSSSIESTSIDQSTTGGESSSSGYNPIWDEAFSAIPDVPEFKDKLRPVFEKWDTNNNQRYETAQQEFAPYRPLLENKVPFEDIQAAFALRNSIAENPQATFEKLAQHLGFDISSLVANGDEESQDLEYSEEDDDPRLAKLAKENQEIKSYLQKQAQEVIDRENSAKQEQQEREYFNTTKQALDSLEEKYGEFDRNAAVRFAIWEAEAKGTDIDFEAGFKAMMEFKGQAIQESASRNAPDVFSGNGSLVSGRVDTSKMNEQQFQEYAVARMKAKLG